MILFFIQCFDMCTQLLALFKIFSRLFNVFLVF